MTSVELFQSFRADVAQPSGTVRADARAGLLELVRGGRPARNRARPTGRRVGLALAGAAGFAGAVFVGVGLLGGGPGVLDRAEAAIDPQGRVLHVVARVVGSDGTVSVGESWVRPDGTGRTLARSGGGPGDCLANEAELRCYDEARNVVDVYRYDPKAVRAGRRYAQLSGFRVDQPESIHRAFASGYARVEGEAEIDGRATWEIRLAIPWIGADGKATPRFDEATSPILYLDRTTYHPVAERFPDSGSTTYYETYQFLPDGARTQRLLELPAKPGARVVVHPVGEGPQG